MITTLNQSNITLMGHSMGGAICIRYMSKFKNYGVSKLCLLSAAAPKWNLYKTTKSIKN
ncbi:alpha/beta fold hydrolase [Intestinibacter bartlettii]